MATHLLGPVNSVPVNSTYPVNGSLFVTKILEGLGTGDRVCVLFENRASALVAQDAISVLAEPVNTIVVAESSVSDVGAGIVVEVPAENRNSTVMPEQRNLVINKRDEC